MTLENKYLIIKANPNGGSFISIFDKLSNKELIYQPIKDSWQGQDVFIFPFVARLKDGKYKCNSKEYFLKNHGLIRYMVGKEEKVTSNLGRISFIYDEDTLSKYPFKFKATSEYELINNKVVVRYIITNLDDLDMPFMVGGHPAFKLPGEVLSSGFDMKGNFINFNKIYQLNKLILDDTFSFVKGIEPYLTTDCIELDKRLFIKYGTIMLRNDDFSYVDLLKSDNSKLRVTFDSKYLAIWSDTKYGNYVAIEPWDGYPDEFSPKLEFKDKAAINILKPKATYTFSYSIEII